MNKSHHDTAMPDWYRQLEADAKACPAHSEAVQRGGYRFGQRGRYKPPPPSDYVEFKDRHPDASKRAAMDRRGSRSH